MATLALRKSCSWHNRHCQIGSGLKNRANLSPGSTGTLTLLHSVGAMEPKQRIASRYPGTQSSSSLRPLSQRPIPRNTFPTAADQGVREASSNIPGLHALDGACKAAGSCSHQQVGQHACRGVARRTTLTTVVRHIASFPGGLHSWADEVSCGLGEQIEPERVAGN